MNLNRRELHQLLGWMTTTIAAFLVGSLNTDEQERLAKAIASPSRVDDQVIDHIEAMLQHCKQQHDALGPQAVLHTVLAQRQLVRSLLDECPAERRPRLLSLDSSMSSSIGFYFFDLDDAASAMHYCDQARAAAQEARNTELAVWALCNMSYFASWQGKAHAAIDFAAAAQSLVSRTDDVPLQVCAVEKSGIAYAVDGQYKECMTEFDRALAGLNSSAGRTSPESPAYWTHEGHVYSQQGYCLLRLSKPTEAAASARKGLRLFDNSFVGSLAFTTLRLATARLQSGEVEEAAQLIGDGALLATRNRSTRLTKEVRTTRARLQPWQETPAVQELDEQLSGMGFGAWAAPVHHDL
jgi:tetratricopeptide (TPR) repeat protein